MNSNWPKAIISCALLLTSVTLTAQIPSNIDVGQDPNIPSMWEQPKYIIPVVLIIIVVVGFGLWRRSKRRER